MDRITQLENEIKELKERMGIGEEDPAKEGYLVLVNILKQQNEYLKEFKIKNNISTEDKGKMNEYERAKGLWEGLTKMIQSVNALKVELKIEGDKVKQEYRPISASSITDGDV